MTKFRTLLLCLATLAGLSLNLLLPLPAVRADFQGDYEGFLKTYDAYRVAHGKYISTRNQYLTYGTLNAKNEALTAVKTLLLARDDTLIGYISLLRQRNVDPALATLLDDEFNFLKNRQPVIPAVASLEDAVKISEEAEERHLPFQITSRKVAGDYIANKIDTLKLQFLILEQEATALIQTLKNQGRQTATLERWLLDAKNKELLLEQKLTQSRSLLAALTSVNLEMLTEDYNKIQFTLFEANQYLKEAIGFMSELSEAIKYDRF